MKRLAQRFGLGRAIGLLLLIAFLGVRFWNPAAVEELRARSFDLYQSIKPRDSANFRPVVIVDIDEASLKSLGQWPWPRTIVADLITKLTDLGALGIAFDVLFAEPDRTSPSVAARNFAGLDDATREKLNSLPSNDDVMAEAMRKSRVVVGQSGLGAAQPDALPPTLTGVTLFGLQPEQAKRFLVTFPVLLGNVPALEKAAAGHGLFSFNPDRDGIVRRAPLAMVAAGQIVPALSTELLRVALQKSTPVVRTNQGGVYSIGVPGYELPTDGKGQVWVYFAPHDEARFVSAKDILEGKVPKDRFDKRLVIVGTSAIGLLDLKTTPVDGAMPGVEVHAQVIEAALSQSFLSYSLFAPLIEMLVTFFVGVLIITLAPMVSALTLLIMGLACATAMAAGSWSMFAFRGELYDVTFPLMSTLGIYAALVFFNYFREQIDRQRIRSAFGQYLSPTLVEQLAKSPDKLVLGGEDRMMTIMFSDVRGFTSISELYKDDPQGLTHLMNNLLTPLTNAIIARNGTIDKYMGDAIMAFWNAPLDDPSHEINACEAALDMLERLHDLNDVREQEAKDKGHKFIPIKVGVGLNTGRVVVGNMGSDMRFQYTVLGDAVNLASRLEGQTKSYGVPILVGSKTAEALKEKYATLELDFIMVKGKSEPEVVFTVFGRSDTAKSDEFHVVRGLVGNVLAAYRAQDWPAALKAVGECRAHEGKYELEAFADLYAERIETYQVTPPPSGWNGAFALQTK